MYLAIVLLNGSLQDTVLILALVQRSDSESSGQTSKTFGPPTLLWFSAGARGPGAPGVGVRVRRDNGLLSTNKSPNFTLASLSQ